MKNLRKKFFGISYFRGAVSPVDFSLFRGSLFRTDFLGKNFVDKLFTPYSEKTPGLPGGGGSGGGTGGVPGGIWPGTNEKPPESVVIRSEGTSLLHSSTVIEPNHPAFLISLAFFWLHPYTGKFRAVPP